MAWPGRGRKLKIALLWMALLHKNQTEPKYPLTSITKLFVLKFQTTTVDKPVGLQESSQQSLQHCHEQVHSGGVGGTVTYKKKKIMIIIMMSTALNCLARNTRTAFTPQTMKMGEKERLDGAIVKKANDDWKKKEVPLAISPYTFSSGLLASSLNLLQSPVRRSTSN
ncbi:hypothetical protein PoB_005893600 [Plakobranchus ocellatus]|uniref:Uncharacterized protein n=1 Tax=Plakobranchus ocellatus TaxID=259542 RepID=A0AAV4CL92_9GAST|nr:hypothetical protein PoB_005893600 [Plakobranchus ocellatus]